MSDFREENREAIQKVLRKNSIFFCVGWFILMLSMIGLTYVWTRPGLGAHPFVGFLNFLGWGIIGWPKIWIMIKGGGLKGALNPSYEVVTTYSDGSRSSDGGAESAQMNILGLIIKIVLLYVIGGIIQIIHLIILTIRYMVLHLQVKPKPAFMQSGMFIIVINIAVLIGSVVVGATVQKIGLAPARARYAAQVKQTEAARANIAGQTLTVNASTLNLRAEASGTSRAIKTLNKGDTITATGNVTNVLWFPVESGSDKGYVFALSVRLENSDMPFDESTIFPYEATTAEKVTIQQFVGSGETTLEQGSKAKVLQEYNGGIMVEYRNLNYLVVGDDMEKFNHVRLLSGSKDRPAEFNRDTPFEATVTEAINGWARMIQSTVEIPAGATVTVTGGISSSGISQAEVTFDEQELFIYSWYLKSAN
jgi:archaellum component FlaF (FlaF/FlaG flagellin family)